MSTQHSLTEEEKDIIRRILKNHNVDLVYETIQVEYEGECEPEDQLNNVSIMVSSENEEKWYIQVN